MNEREFKNLILGIVLIVSFFIVFTWFIDSTQAIGIRKRISSIDLYANHHHSPRIYLPLILRQR